MSQKCAGQCSVVTSAPTVCLMNEIWKVSTGHGVAKRNDPLNRVLAIGGNSGPPGQRSRGGKTEAFSLKDFPNASFAPHLIGIMQEALESAVAVNRRSNLTPYRRPKLGLTHI
jgi:hypothetical protein